MSQTCLCFSVRTMQVCLQSLADTNFSGLVEFSRFSNVSSSKLFPPRTLCKGERMTSKNIPNAPTSSVTTAGEDSMSIGGAIGDGIIVTGENHIAVVGGQVLTNEVVGNLQSVEIGDVTTGSNIIFSDILYYKNLPLISEEQAFERIGAAVRLNLHQIQRNIEQARQDSGHFFKLTLLFSCFGFLAVLVGVTLLLLDKTTAGVVTSVAGIIPEVVAVLFLSKDKELRNTIETYHKHMLDSQQILTMIDVAETIRDHQGRDEMKRRIIYKVLNINP
jgi:hypothetical protein